MRPGAVLISSDTAHVLGLNSGDTLGLSAGGIRRNIQLVGLMNPGDEVSREALADLLVADIATAQEVLGMQGRLSRIDVVLPEGEYAEPVLERIRAVLPPGVDIERSSTRSESVDQLTRAFEVNLAALSMLALIVGAFLIYNTMTFSVVRRRKLIGTLRAIGVTRGEIFTLVLGEAFLIGLVSAVFGVLLGILLGRGLVNIVTQTINDLFFVVSVRELTIPVFVLLKGGLLGIFVALVAALVPALEANSVTARAAMARSTIETRLRRTIPHATFMGVLILVIGMVLLLIPTKSLLISFGGLGALLLGLALIIPLSTVLLLKIFSPLARRSFGMLGFMAAQGTSASFSRTAVAITALTISVSITVGIGTMVQSFRETVDRWLETSLGADIYVSPPSMLSSRVEATISPIVLDRLVTAPGIDGASSFRGAQVKSPNGPVQLVALGTQFETFNRPERFKAGNPAEIWDGFQRGDTIIVSEPYAFHNDLDIGSSVRLLTDQGERNFRVAGIYFDYSSSRGVVMMSRSAYQRFWNDDGISSVGLYAAPGQDVDALIQQLYQVVGDEQELRIRSNLNLREASLVVFDRSFTITSVLRVLAMVVAFVGVLSALMALQLERSREIGTLRAMGFTLSQIWRMITSQTGLMGLIAGLLSVPMGLALAVCLIFVVNRRSFGWSMEMQIFPIVLVEAVALAVVAALLAGIYPGIRMAMSSPAAALREE
jgi:putative ABC transport system permease protein